VRNFEPKVVAFLCRWCSEAAAERAGAARARVAPNLLPVRVPCTGRVDPQMILHAFAGGADGVLVLGCHPGDCHYREGNLRARDRVLLLGAALAPLGIEPARLRLEWVSATEGDRFVRVVEEAVEALRRLGPRKEAAGRPA
jgi:F420-non-reducing hydrogenase iron-sulfur subunit